jgi:adenosylcobyric acid synthase
MFPSKVTSQVDAAVEAETGFFTRCPDQLGGYEIHMGRSTVVGDGSYCFRIVARDGKPADALDGFASPDGRAWGTYIHGIFDNDCLREKFLEDLAERAGKPFLPASGAEPFSYGRWKEQQFDLLADFVRKHVDIERIMEIVLR